MTTPSHAASLIERTDHVRHWSSTVGATHKQWFHFSVSCERVDALVNFSLVQSDPHAPPTPRVTILVFDGKSWRGEVQRFDASLCTPGDVAVRMGDCGFHLDGGAFHVHARSASGDLVVDLRLEPVSLPSLVHNVRLGPGPALHWLIAPRLRARGRITVDGIDTKVDHHAYHDHNWGGFAWGGDYAWEWGYANDPSAEPGWSMVFVRMNDRAHHRTRSQALFVWAGERQVKVFRGHDVRMQAIGCVRAGRVPRFPSIMGLLVDGTATDVPATLSIEGARDRDRVRIEFRAEAVAQLIVPNDAPPGVTTINEVNGTAVCEGRIGDRDLAFTTRTVVEFLRG